MFKFNGWGIVSCVLALFILYLLFWPVGQSDAIKEKDNQITRLEKQRDSALDATRGAHVADSLVADGSLKDSLKNVKQRVDSAFKVARKAQADKNVLARRVLKAEAERDAALQDTDAVDLAKRVLIDSAAISDLQEDNKLIVKFYDSTLNIKQAVIDAQAVTINIDQQLMQDYKDKAALQSAEIRKFKKRSVVRGVVAGVAAGFAAAGWILLFVR